jgi:hypothetical protein
MLDEAVSKLADHESGVRRLEEDDHATITKRVSLYRRKLESMADELDERVRF